MAAEQFEVELPKYVFGYDRLGNEVRQDDLVLIEVSGKLQIREIRSLNDLLGKESFVKLDQTTLDKVTGAIEIQVIKKIVLPDNYNITRQLTPDTVPFTIPIKDSEETILSLTKRPSGEYELSVIKEDPESTNRSLYLMPGQAYYADHLYMLKELPETNEVEISVITVSLNLPDTQPVKLEKVDKLDTVDDMLSTLRQEFPWIQAEDIFMMKYAQSQLNSNELTELLAKVPLNPFLANVLNNFQDTDAVPDTLRIQQLKNRFPELEVDEKISKLYSAVRNYCRMTQIASVLAKADGNVPSTPEQRLQLAAEFQGTIDANYALLVEKLQSYMSTLFGEPVIVDAATTHRFTSQETAQTYATAVLMKNSQIAFLIDDLIQKVKKGERTRDTVIDMLGYIALHEHLHKDKSTRSINPEWKYEETFVVWLSYTLAKEVMHSDISIKAWGSEAFTELIEKVIAALPSQNNNSRLADKLKFWKSGTKSFTAEDVYRSAIAATFTGNVRGTFDFHGQKVTGFAEIVRQVLGSTLDSLLKDVQDKAYKLTRSTKSVELKQLKDIQDSFWAKLSDRIVQESN